MVTQLARFPSQFLSLLEPQLEKHSSAMSFLELTHCLTVFLVQMEHFKLMSVVQYLSD